jgi:hypothetical protein
MRGLICFAVAVVVACLTGCAGAVRTEGTSGPVAWHATNFALVEKLVGPTQDQLAEAQTFDLIIKNISERTITFTECYRTVYTPGSEPGGRRVSVQWRLEPGAEQKVPLFMYRYCRDARGCIDLGANQALWRMILTGQDEENRAINIRFDIAPPPQATKMINVHPGGRAATDR